ncbi:anhydro-N-acetylmuramic acid kinase [Anseongella ginsenosidimutans]|uniref:Anhydro-N-acetylmuramic acid kinase n=1 Tax=Anseongella ginsenosidimutans TaxID=496056 RepID=A0A4R3KWK5_9SPHI|nr:anhydro-N-acetylmuramic acid kinase [Anseongella ginsenosidimutans]QEC51531.1 anhydro-N-acetylmuramic acid kinase [Anseongella ginsenosidimutans]TCS88850.1 anhydro-N-acetylmuramic acid kinase [Anseongella ginsenosidimutans]
MNQQIQRLFEIASKKERLIIGLMSGTSLDGLDVALCHFQGHGRRTRARLEKFDTIPYDDEIKEEIRSVFARTEVDFQQLCLLHAWLGKLHGSMVLELLENWNISPASVDLVASHGQTVFHAPVWMHNKPKFGNATLQIGDTDHLAVRTGIISVGDFRQKHVAAGGEGAPLAAYGDYLLYSSAHENRVLLNIGGIANYTFLPAGGNVKTMFATDVGPGNTLIDAAVQKFFGRPFDPDGSIARSGEVNETLISALQSHPFFKIPLPKTTGPELFNLSFLDKKLEETGIKTLSPAGLVASLTAFAAACIVQEMKLLLEKYRPLTIYLSGGGMHNPFLTGMIIDALPDCKFDTTQSLGINPDAKEAVLFAALANETVAGNGATFKGNTSGLPAISMGKISFPR